MWQPSFLDQASDWGLWAAACVNILCEVDVTQALAIGGLQAIMCRRFPLPLVPHTAALGQVTQLTESALALDRAWLLAASSAQSGTTPQEEVLVRPLHLCDPDSESYM